MGGERVRVGVIGAGSWAVSVHIPTLQARDDVELVSAVRTGSEALSELQERFGFEHVSEDYRDLLEQDLDAVIVSSPGGLHYEHTKAALSAGVNVLCEKPFTLDPAHAWDLVAASEEVGNHLLLSFGWHYRPIVLAAKNLWAEHGGVGQVEHVLVAMASGTRELLAGRSGYKGASEDLFAPQANTWVEPSMSGGGYAPAQLSHAMGLALWLTGDRAAEVYAMMNNLGGPVDMHDAVSLRFDSGATGVVSGASAPASANAIDAPDEPWPRHQLQVRVYGSQGQLIVDLERDFLWLYREDGVDEKVDLPEHAGLYECDGPPNTLVDLTLQKAGATNRSPAELGARTVEFVAAAERSAQEQTLVRAHD